LQFETKNMSNSIDMVIQPMKLGIYWENVFFWIKLWKHAQAAQGDVTFLSSPDWDLMGYFMGISWDTN
jgi:hypothetical protein